MKKLFLLVSILAVATISCQTTKEDNKASLDENKRISTLYHERNLEDIDELLSEDFVGSYFSQDAKPNTWNRDDHKNAITSNPNNKDSILIQIAEGDWVAERFIRTFYVGDTTFTAEVMQFKKIKNGKIISSWEVFSTIR